MFDKCRKIYRILIVFVSFFIRKMSFLVVFDGSMLCFNKKKTSQKWSVSHLNVNYSIGFLYYFGGNILDCTYMRVVIHASF